MADAKELSEMKKLYKNLRNSPDTNISRVIITDTPVFHGNTRLALSSASRPNKDRKKLESQDVKLLEENNTDTYISTRDFLQK